MGRGARSTPLKTSAGGRLGSARSKTQDPACSQAMSLWVRARHGGAAVAAEVFKVLAGCRAKARALNLSKGHAIAGNELKSQVWAKRAEAGLSGAARQRKAAELRGQLEGRRAARAAAKAPRPAPKAEPGFSLKQESAIGKKGFRTEDTGRGRTGTLFDMKRGDLKGQTSLLDRVGSTESNPRARRYERLGARSLELQDELARARAGRARELVDRRREARARAADRSAGEARGHTPPRTESDAAAIRSAFERHPGARDNFVKLHDLRRSTGLDRGRFDAALRHLRAKGAMTLNSHEGLHGKLTPEERASGVREQGSHFHYASLKGDAATAAPPAKAKARAEGGRPAAAPRPTSRPFHEQVTEAADRVPMKHRFGDNKAFISDVHAAHQADRSNPRMSLDRFKAALLEHRTGPLGAKLSRADLVQAMDPDRVAKSHTPLHFTPPRSEWDRPVAEFHFVRTSGEAPAAGKAKAQKAKLSGGPAVGKVSPEFELARARERLATRGRTAAKLRELKGLKDLERAPEVHARPGDYANVKTSAIQFDPERFQYKIGAAAHTGSVGSLAGVKKYDPELAGAVSVWRDPANGQTYVVNGHNRLDLAKKLGVDKVHVKYLDAPDAATARAKGAITNIAEGRGTSLDAAKFFKDTGLSREDIAARGVPLRERVATEGLDLARLDDRLFKHVVSGELSTARGAILGGSGLTHDQQHAVHSQLEKMGRKGQVSDSTLKELVDNARHAGSRTAKTHGLFGDDEEQQSLAIHRAAVQGDIKRQLAGEKRLFGLVSKSKAAEQLAEKGRSSIDTEATGAVSKEAAGILGVFDTLKNRSGPVSSALNHAAERIANGEHRPTVVKETRARIAREIEAFFGGGGG